ncbi:hypothetical protein ABZX85_31315 [Streptomyces sp. NPDC004539]|uniref:hypothetical protein n=1 Tax=Streptomyces sp. NPDC004539 TaxID=3154280 RepID=UPI0033A53D86
MSYQLNAVIGDFDLLGRLPDVPVVPLRQRMGLVPVTGQLLASPPPAFEQTLSHWCRGGPIAHVEAEFHGGAGKQAATVWRAGVRVWGPVAEADFAGPRENWPINAALALLGVVPTEHLDPFLGVGLGRERDMEGWRSAAWPASYDAWHAEHERAERAAAEHERRSRLTDVPAALDGKAIMELLGTPPGPLIGEATRHLQELHLEHGPLTREEAETRLRSWAVEQGAGRAGFGPRIRR